MRKPIFMLIALMAATAHAGNPPHQSQGQQISDQQFINQPTPDQPLLPEDDEVQYTQEFAYQECTFQNTGNNRFFNLTPGHKASYSSEGESIEISVLDETEEVNLPEVGPIQTRVVEERVTSNGANGEPIRYLVAICEKTNDVYLFGDGQWRAGEGSATPGLLMPGTFLLGSRYVKGGGEEAQLRAENTAVGLEEETEVENYTECVEVTETTTNENEEDRKVKVYCPDVGLVAFDGFRLSNLEAGQAEAPTM